MGLQISVRKSDNVAIIDLQGRIVIGDTNVSFEGQLRKLADEDAMRCSRQSRGSHADR